MDFIIRFKLILIVILVIFIINGLYFLFINPPEELRKNKSAKKDKQLKDGQTKDDTKPIDPSAGSGSVEKS